MAVNRADSPGALPLRCLSASKITTDLWPHPLTAEGRETRPAVVPPDATLADLIADVFPGASALKQRSGRADAPIGESAGAPIIAAVNGRVIPRVAWAETRLRDGQIVTLRALAGDGGDKNPLRVLLQLAVIVASVFVPPLITSSLLGQAAIGAAITIAGGLVINAIAPLPSPDTAQAARAGPIYSLTGGANRARPYEPLLLVLGEHRVFPDLGAAEYTEIVGDDQYLHQIFNFGLGALDVGDLRIGDTPLDAFEEVQTEFGDAQGRVRLVAGNVDTEAGAALDDTAFVERATAPGTQRIGIDLGGRLFRVNERDGAIQGHSADIEIEWEAPGVAVQRRTLTLTHERQTLLRRTLAYDLGSARDWTVRVRRTSEPSTDERTFDDLAWTALRSYQPDEADYEGQTRLGVRIRASGQLTGRLDRLSAIVRQKVPAWDGAAWTGPMPSSNPAYLFRWYARGLRIGSRLVAGLGLAPGRIDDDALIEWGAWCAAQGLRCDIVLDRAISHAEVLTLIARCGRAAVTWQTGRLGVIWDAEDRPATALVTPGNIVAGSFRVEYATGQAAEEVAVRYIEPALDWQYNTLRRTVPGAGAQPASTATITLHGVTGRAQAAIACNLQAARQVYHRRRLIWEMAAEGLSLARGDVVTITHSLIDGGAAGRLTGGSVDRVRLDRAVDLSAPPGATDPGTGNAQLLLRLIDGTVHQTAVSRPPGVAPEGAPGSESGETDELVLADPLPAAPGADDANPRDILWRLYDDALPPVRARIIAVRPSGDRHVRFVAIDEVASYYDAATADLSAPFPDLAPRPPRVLDIAIAETLVRVGAGFAVEIEAALTVAGDWRGGVVRASVNGETPRTVARLVDGETRARWLAPPSGALTLTVTPGTEAAPSGPPYTARHEITGSLAPPGAPTNVLIDVLGDGTRRLRWTPPADIDLAGVLIRFAPAGAGAQVTWEAMMPLHRGHLTASPLETVEPPPGEWIFSARAIDAGGRLSDEVRILAELGPQRLGDALLWRCPAATGWPGTIAGAGRSDDGRDALEGIGDYTWADLTTWADWQSWGAGNGADAATEIVYTEDPIDLGGPFDVALRWSGETAGDRVFEYRAGATEAALRAAAWMAYPAGTTVAARWLQVRWRITGDGTVVLSLDHVCWSVHAPAAARKLLDRNTADWQGTAADGRIVPHDLGLVTDLDITLQSVGAGWTWTLVSKNNPTRIRIYDGAGNPADALVDAVVRGVEA